MMETYRGVVHPWLCDIMGHLTTRHYVAMFDDASYHLGHACGIRVNPENPTEGFVDAKLELEFASELRAGALIVIHSAIARLGNTSFTAVHRMYNLEDMSLAAKMTAVSVAFDLEMRKPVSLTDEFRRRASAMMDGGQDNAS